MELEEKIFRMGIYGSPVSSLSRDELQAVCKIPHVEIVPRSEIEKLRDKFTLKPLKTIKKKCNTVLDDCYIRMETLAWRDYIFGKGNTFRSREYFQLIDFLLPFSDFVSVADVRSKLQITPKTMHYLTKKLKDLNIIEEQRQGNQLIKLKPSLMNVSGIKPFSEKIFKQADTARDSSGICLYNNVPFAEQVSMHLRNSSEGMDSIMLYKKTGIKKRAGLKLLQKICTENQESFCMVTEMCHKSTVCRFYHVPKYEEIVRKRIERIKGSAAIPSSCSMISAYEKEVALRMLAEKHGSFGITKDIITELSEMTGWAYSFDRRGLLKTAQNAGLHVTKKDRPYGPKYIISRVPPHEWPETVAQIEPVTLDLHGVMLSKIRHLFLINPGFVKADNGFAINSWAGLADLFDFITRELSETETYTAKKLAAKIPVGLFYRIKPFHKPNLKYDIAFNIWKRNRERFDPSHSYFKAGVLFSKNAEELEFLDEDIFMVEKQVDELPLNEYLDLIPSNYFLAIRHRASVVGIRPALEKLAQCGLISLEEEEHEVIIRNGMASHPKERLARYVGRTHERPSVDYNTRKELYYRLLSCDSKNFETDAKSIFTKSYPEKTARIFLSKLLKTRAVVRQPVKYECTLASEDRETYLQVKRSLVNGTFESLRDSAVYIAESIEKVVRYLVYKRVVSSRHANAETSDVTLSVKFRCSFQKYKSGKGPEARDDLYGFYFNKIYKTVREAKSVDTDALLEKCRYIEDFELLRFFSFYDDIFELKRIDEFILVSLKDKTDPFFDLSE